jgi:antitoxin component HigA of HigAB toxin-antitoxin module
MVLRIERDCEFRELVSEFPLSPINDDHAYSQAIAILDRLFEFDEQRSPDETEYFHALALLACEYEQKGGRSELH